jgi:hypothetical protein
LHIHGFLPKREAQKLVFAHLFLLIIKKKFASARNLLNSDSEFPACSCPNILYFISRKTLTQDDFIHQRRSLALNGLI